MCVKFFTLFLPRRAFKASDLYVYFFFYQSLIFLSGYFIAFTHKKIG